MALPVEEVPFFLSGPREVRDMQTFCHQVMLVLATEPDEGKQEKEEDDEQEEKQQQQRQQQQQQQDEREQSA